MENKRRNLQKRMLGFFLLLSPLVIDSPNTSLGIKERLILIATTIFFFFKNQVFPRLIEMFKALYVHPETLWLVVPLLVTVLFMQLYFGRWKTEKLGWNSVLGNMIALLFVSVNLLNYVWQKYTPEEIIHLGTPLYSIVLIGAVISQVILMMIFIYLHAIPKNLSFFLGSPLTVNTIAFVVIVLVYGEIPLNWTTLAAFLSLYVLVQLFFWGFRWIIPPSKQAKQYLHVKEKKEKKIKAEEKRVSTLKRHLFIKKLKEKFSNLKSRIMGKGKVPPSTNNPETTDK